METVGAISDRQCNVAKGRVNTGKAMCRTEESTARGLVEDAIMPPDLFAFVWIGVCALFSEQ